MTVECPPWASQQVKSRVAIGIGHDAPLDESDYGYSEWVEQIASSMKGLKGWKVVATEPAGDPLRYSIGGKTVSFSSFEEVAPLFSYCAPSTVQGVSVDLLKKEIGRSTTKKWMRSFDSTLLPQAIREPVRSVHPAPTKSGQRG